MSWRIVGVTRSYAPRPGRAWPGRGRAISARWGACSPIERVKSPSGAEHAELDGCELTEFTYFGKPAMLATWRSLGTHGAMLLSDTLRHGLLWARPLFGKRGSW